MLYKINKFYVKGSPVKKAIEINNERLHVARQIDILSGNTKCEDAHKRTDLYKYVTSLNNK